MRDFFQSDLAELCAECEKYIGTQGGKFDLKISLSNPLYDSQVVWIKLHLVLRVVVLYVQ